MREILNETLKVFENRFFNLDDFLTAWLKDHSKEIFFEDKIVSEGPKLFYMVPQIESTVLLASIDGNFNVILEKPTVENPSKEEIKINNYLKQIEKYFRTFDISPYKLGA